MKSKSNVSADKQALFETMPVPKAVAKSAIPAILSTLVILVYNLADTYFVGQTHDAMKVAAVSLTTPVFLLLTAFGVLFGVGGATLISRSLGQGKVEYCKNVSSFCFWISVALGVICAFIFWCGMDWILSIIGTDVDTVTYAEEYLNVIAWGAPFIILTNTFSNMFRAEGKSNEAMFGMAIGTILNIILDPIMILWFDWGVTGAAVATVIGNVANILYYLFILFKGNTILSVAPKYFTFRQEIGMNVFGIGVPAALGNILLSVANILANNLIVAYGSLAVAAFGVAQKVVMIVVYILQGYGIGIQPLLGYCYGAKNQVRFKKIMHFSYITIFIVSMILLVICGIAAGPLVNAFIDDPEVYDFGVQFVKIMLITTPFVGYWFIFTNCIQAMGKATPSFILSLAQRGFCYIPLLYVFRSIGGLSGIVAAQPFADIISCLLSWFLYLWAMKQSKKEMVIRQEGLQ